MKSLRNELILSFAFVIVVAIVPMIAFSYRITEELLESRMSVAAMETLGQLGNGLDMILSDAQDLSLFAISDNNVRSYLKSSDSNETEYLGRLTATFTSLISYKPYITSVNIYGDNGLSFETAGPSRVMSESVSETVLPESGTFVISPPYQRWYSTVGEQYILSFSRQINDINSLNSRLGRLRFDISEDVICGLYRNISTGSGGGIYIAGTDGTILSHVDKSMLAKNINNDSLFAEAFQGGNGHYRKTIGGKRMMVSYYTNKDFNIVSISVINLDEILADALSKQNILVLVVVFPLCAAILLAALISRSISSAIRQLTDKMREVENGDLNVELVPSRKDEIGVLVKSFNIMVSRLKGLVDEVYISHINRKKAELNALEAQIHPHFLYNTLDSIYWMARIEKAERTQKAVIGLSKFYRYSLNRGQSVTLVKQELEHLNSYLSIQMLTYLEPPVIVIDVEPSLFACKISKLTLQPIMENALFHGVSGMGREGRVTLTGRDTGANMEFTIEDNGHGIPQEVVSRVNGEKHAEIGGYGLHNVDERIKLYFGDAYGVVMESGSGGTRVRISLPKKE